MEIVKIWDQNSQTPEPIDKKFGMGDYVGNDSPHAKIQNWRGGVCVKYHPRVIFSFPILSYPFLWSQILLESQD